MLVRQTGTAIDGEEQNIKLLQWGLNTGPLDHHENFLLNELSQHLVASLNHQGPCSADSSKFS